MLLTHLLILCAAPGELLIPSADSLKTGRLLPQEVQAAPPQAEADTLAQDPGIYGTAHPQVGDIVLAETLVHTDREGRASHQLLDLVGVPGHGFAAVWRDMRDGNAGLYFGRLDPEGRPLEAERALYPEGTTYRELEPAIALSARGNGAFVWYSSGISLQSLILRTFDAQGHMRGPGRPMGNPPAGESTGGRPSAFAEVAASEGRRAGGGLRLPAIAMTENWGAVAWGDNGTLWIQRFDPEGNLLGGAQVLSTPERVLTGPMRLCANPAEGGALACAWTTRDGVEWARIGDQETARGFLSAGVLERLVAAPGSAAGWWALVATSTGHRLVSTSTHPSAVGAPPPALIDLGVSPREACDVAAAGALFTISVQHASGDIELLRLDPRVPEPRPELLSKIDVSGTSAQHLRVAASGDRSLVAWTGSAARLSDIWFSTVSVDASPSAPRRWNSDESSAPQNQGRIASRGKDRAALAWLDGRSGENQLMARWIGADGKFLCDEFAVTPRVSGAGDEVTPLAGEPMDPSLALGADGGFLLAWKQMEKRGYRLLAQAFDAAGKAQSAILELDAGEDAPPSFKADIDVCALDRGYAVAFGRRDRGVFVRAVQAGGRGMGEPVLVFEHPLCQDVALSALDDGSLALAWDITVPGAGNRAVRARVLERDLSPRGALIEPPLSIFGHDWDPALTPMAGGGFAMAFTGGVMHNRDVFLRCFDGKGALASPLIPISSRMNEQDWPVVARLSDGSLCVAFEDDLSAYDHCYVRRVRAGGTGDLAATLGPVRTLNSREALLNETRVIPRIAPLAGGGFAAVWTDSRRSKGTDVRVQIVGPNFDAP